MVSPGDNILAALIQEDDLYLSNDPDQHRALLLELREEGFSDDFIAERLPKLRAYM